MKEGKGKFVQPDVLRQSKQYGNLVSSSAFSCDLAMMLLITRSLKGT